MGPRVKHTRTHQNKPKYASSSSKLLHTIPAQQQSTLQHPAQYKSASNYSSSIETKRHPQDVYALRKRSSSHAGFIWSCSTRRVVTKTEEEEVAGGEYVIGIRSKSLISLNEVWIHWLICLQLAWQHGPSGLLDHFQNHPLLPQMLCPGLVQRLSNPKIYWLLAHSSAPTGDDLNFNS